MCGRDSSYRGRGGQVHKAKGLTRIPKSDPLASGCERPQPEGWDDGELGRRIGQQVHMRFGFAQESGFAWIKSQSP